MTTHFVQIRLKAGGELAPWEALTHAPIPLKDAEGLTRQIGSSWEARIVVAPTPSAPIPYVTLLERLNTIAVIAPELSKHHDYPQDDAVLVDTVRQGLFGVLEHYRGGDTLLRWKASDHEVIHARKCKGGYSKVHVKVLPALLGRHAESFLELGVRVHHVAAQTIPALGIVATVNLLTPKLHVVSCPVCHKTSEAVSAMVEIVWGEHSLRREYLL